MQKITLFKLNLKDISIILILFLFGMFLYFIGFGVPCVFHSITGLKCPGCGITHMFESIFKFEFLKAFKYNQYAFTLLILGICYLIYYISCLILKVKPKEVSDKVMYSLIAIGFLFMIIRNLVEFNFI